MSDAIDEYLTEIGRLRIPRVTPHGDNLLHQVKITSRKRAEVEKALQALVPAYSALVAQINRVKFDDVEKQCRRLAKSLDEYFGIARHPPNDIFVSQSDFKTSIIPEFFLRIAHAYLTRMKLPYMATGQTDIPIEIAFDLKRPELVVPRLQRVDFAIVKPVEMQVGGKLFPNFYIPLVAAEVKTYFDKNMITGVAYSVGALKTTFPHCLYIAISEFADFALSDDSYATTEIDEIYILRKQKRSEFRRSAEAMPTSPELIGEIVSLIIDTIASHSKIHRDLKLRVPHGRLILGNPEL